MRWINGCLQQLLSPSQDLRKSFGNFLHCSIPRRLILKRDGEWNNEKVVQNFHQLIFCHNAFWDITIITSMFHPFKIKANTEKHFSCFRFVLKNFMQNLPKKRESVFPRPPNIECMRYTSKCPHDAEYPRVKRNQLLTLSGFFRARIRNQDDTWRRSWAIVGAKIAVKVGPSFCNLASFKAAQSF